MAKLLIIQGTAAELNSAANGVLLELYSVVCCPLLAGRRRYSDGVLSLGDLNISSVSMDSPMKSNYCIKFEYILNKFKIKTIR